MTTPHLVTCCLWDYVQVLKQINEGSAGGRGIVVQEVHAPVAVVMGRILDYGNYPKMVSKLMTQPGSASLPQTAPAWHTLLRTLNLSIVD